MDNQHPGQRKRTVFLDRDGVLNQERGDYVFEPSQLSLIPGAAQAVAAFTKAGWSVVVFTNQAGVGRGYYTLATLDAIHDRMRAEIEAEGGTLEGIYACPHHPDDNCLCRKPKPGLLLEAASELSIDLASSWVIGDSPRDIAAGHAVGCSTIVVLTGHTKQYDASVFPDPQPDQVFPDLAAAANWLITQF